jgi:hypothetical protein
MRASACGPVSLREGACVRAIAEMSSREYLLSQNHSHLRCCVSGCDVDHLNTLAGSAQEILSSL